MKRIIVFVLLVMAMPVFGGVKYEDINKDGVKEKILQRENVTYEQRDMLTVTRQGKTIFVYKPDKIKGYEGFKIDDFDSCCPGKEILVFIPTIPDPHGEGIGMRAFVLYQYIVVVYRWDKKEKKYLAYWTFYINDKKYKPDQVAMIYKYIKSERPKFRTAEVRAVEFVRAVGQGDWVKVKRMVGKDLGSSNEYKNLQSVCKHSTPSATWQMFDSPHDRNNVCFIASANLPEGKRIVRQPFMVIVAPEGMVMWRGDCWD